MVYFWERPVTTQISVNTAFSGIITEIVAKASTSMSGHVVQRANVVATGKDSVVRNSQILQNAKITISGVQSAANEGKLQADITNTILSKLRQKEEGDPMAILSGTANDQRVRNTIHNEVHSAFDSSALAEMSMAIDQEASLTALSGALIEEVKIAQTADMMGKLINTLSNSISSKLIASGDFVMDASTEKTSWLSTLTSLFGLNDSTRVMIVVVVFLLVIAGTVAAVLMYRAKMAEKVVPSTAEVVTGGARHSIEH